MTNRSTLWRQENRERSREQGRAYYAHHREELLKKQKEWNSAHPDRVRGYRQTYNAKKKPLSQEQKEKRNAMMLAAARKRLYGLSIDMWEALVHKQNGLCALCGKAKKLTVDHDHTTGRVRGLLCRPCNAALGTLGDNEHGLKKALEYVL